MSTAQQAFLLTGELVVLSFAAIFAFWFADRVRPQLLRDALAAGLVARTELAGRANARSPTSVTALA
jgi:hypothetical protein